MNFDELDSNIKSFLEKELNKIKNLGDISAIEEIVLLDNLLNKISKTREIINETKILKDNKIREYIKNSLPPRILDINLLTYKSLLFYFRDSFINKKIKLNYEKYEEKNNIKDSKIKEFFPTGETALKIYLNNFPHLIGIKNNLFGNSNKTIEYIFYEHKLIDDFLNDNSNTDIEKLETFSWIISTLYNPTWIINKKNILAKNFKSDLVFIKSIYYDENYSGRKKYYYHIVGLNYLKKDNCFIIKSQFPIKNKPILKRKFDLENNEGLVFKTKYLK